MKQDRNGVRTAQDLERKYDFSSISTLKRNYEIQKLGLTKVENEMNNFVSAVTKNIKDIQNQVDGNITTWFSSGLPTIDNYPASDWKTNDDKNNHLGDLYYDKETGYAYRYSLENEEYSWVKISDVDITKALAIANSAQDTADSKRRVFVIRPSPPYDVGDLWIKDEELYRCQTTRPEGETFEDNDWIKATKYTDDTYAIQVGKDLTVLSGTVTEIKNGVDEISQTITHTNTLVDAQGKEIGVLSKETSEILQSLQEIWLKISGIFEISDTVSGVSQVEVPSLSETTGFELKIINACQYFKSKWLFKSKTKFLKGSWLRITYDDKSYNRYKLPPLSLRKLNDAYDEMNIKSGKVTVTKRIGINENNELYLLDKEITTTYDDLKLLLKEGKNIIQLESFPDAEFSVNYMVNNPFTEEFATKMELSSSIKILNDSIKLAVEGKIGKTEAQSLIDISLESIKLELSKKIGEERVNTLIEAAINQYELIVSKEIEDSSDALSEDLNKKITENSENIDNLNTNLSGKIDETKANELIDDKTKNFIDETKANELIENKTSPLEESINKVDTKYKESVDNINEEMGTKIGQDDYTAAIIIGKINDEESELLISADKLNLIATDILNILSGNTINMTAKNMSFESTNWSIDNSGKMYLKDKVTDIGNEKIDANLTIESTVYPNIAKFTSNGIRMIHNDDGDGEKTDSYLGSHSLFMFYEKGDVFNYLIQDICLQTTVEENNNITQKYIPVITLMEDESSLNQHNTMITSRGITTNGKISATDIFAETLDVTGSKHRIVKIDNNEYIALNAYETATPYFGDIGSGITDENGYCRIEIENIFSQTIEIDTYKVFLQELGEGNLYVKKHDRYFEVFGTPNLEFDYEIKC